MPVYNAEQFVESSIKSVLNQTFSEFEFLIIDDGSTDSTEEIISSFNDSRIIYKKKPHTGLSDSLNNGLSLATYNWVARMDADDLAHPLRLEKQISFMNANPTYKVIASWYGVFENNKIKYTVKSDAKDFNIKKILSLHSPFCHAGVLYNKRTIMIEGYRNLVFEDYDLWLRIMK
jgi:glycosyltransferase involved in cell wall biosynthesis